VSLGAARIERHSLAGRRDRLVVRSIHDLQNAEYGVGPALVGIELQGPARRLIGPLARHSAEQHIAIIELPDIDRRPRVAGVGVGEPGVERDRLLVE
jgi:hypothetical protein